MAAKKKIVPRTGKDRRKNQRRSIFTEFKKMIVGIALLIFVCLIIAMSADIFLAPHPIKKESVALQDQPEQMEKKIQVEMHKKNDQKKINGPEGKPENSIKYEIFDDIDHTALEKPALPQKDVIPQIAIIIDDIGYDEEVSMALCNLNSNITFSILPFSPFGKRISEELHSKGSQLMLHLPMEPVEYPQINPGPGAILSMMSPDVLIDQLKKDIADVSHIVGVNNHMGSKLTANSDQMNQIFSILKKKKLFFVDSRTSTTSQCKPSARLLRVEFAQRDVFLDNFQDTEYITGQLIKLINLAEKHGSAIGIGHPYQTTLESLSKELPRLKDRVKIVRASVLTQIPG